MDDFSNIIVYMAPWPVYDKINTVSLYVASLLTPTLLIFAIVFRTLETQLGTFEGSSKWSSAFKDFFLWGTALTLYFLIGNLLIDYFNSIYAALAASTNSGGLGGSLSSITNSLSSYISKAEKFVSSDDEGILGALGNAFAGGALAFSYFIYYVTIIGVVFVTIFMRLAFAIGFGLVYIWGLIAIPLSMTSNIKMLKGWGVFSGGILIWPVIEAIIIALIIPVFDVGVEGLLGGYDSADATKASIYAIFSVLNLVLIAIMIASPFVAGALASNNSAMSGLVMPFVGSALAATSGAASILRKQVLGGANAGARGAGSGASWAAKKALGMGSASGGGDAHSFTKPTVGKSGVFNGGSVNSSAEDGLSSFKKGGVAAATNTLNEAMMSNEAVTTTNSSETAVNTKPSMTKTSSDTRPPETSDARKKAVKNYFQADNANKKFNAGNS